MKSNYKSQTTLGLKLCMLHSYRNLCFCLHKYFFTFLLSMYDLYATPFSYHGLHINYIKTFQNKNFNSLHNFIPWNFTFIQQLIFIKWKCFQRSQIPTYILTKSKLNKKFLKSMHHMAPHDFPYDFTCIKKWQRLFI